MAKAKPIEILIRDEIADLMEAEWLLTNDYYFDIGDINEFTDANVTAFPRVLIIPGDETNQDYNRGASNMVFHNEITFSIIAEFQHANAAKDTQDNYLECAKLADDIKRFFGNHYQFGRVGGFECHYMGYKKHHSNNIERPTGINAKILIKYRQFRNDPEQAG